MKRRLRVFIITLLCCLGIHPGLAESNQLQQIDHHKLQKESLELSRISFYFTHDPKIVVDNAKKDKGTLVILFPDMVQISDVLKKKIESVNKDTNGIYALILSPIALPRKGMQLTITYDTNKISLGIDSYPSIKQQHGLIIHVYNKALIQRIQSKDIPILKTAYALPPKIVIDCGHGGSDTGAVGCNNLQEKTINLQVGQKVAELLKKNGLQVLLTREDDYEVALDQRTGYANQIEAQAFISIHANAATNKQAKGIETYYLGKSKFKKYFCMLDQQEKKIIEQAMQERCKQSQSLAIIVHNALIKTLKTEYPIQDRNIRPTVSQVLLGNSNPAMLVEIGYLSNPQEAQLLTSASYQYCIAQGICSGILSYLQQTNYRL